VEIQNIDHLLVIAKENLLNLSLFNFVYVNYNINTENQNNIDISITTEERWYIWPMINLVLEDRNLSSWLNRGDMGRVTLDAGMKAYNLWGLNHIFTCSIKSGYQRGFRIEYNNIVIDKKGALMMNLGLYREYSHTENILIKDNTPYYYKSDNFIVNKYFGMVGFIYRPRIRIRHSISLMYENSRISGTILDASPDYWGGCDTIRKGYTIDYTYSSDQRDNNKYPLDGYFISGEFKGFITDNNKFRYGQLTTNMQYYYPLTDRWNMSASITAGISAKNKHAYIFDKAIGYENAIIRGMEYYVADGQHYVALNPTIKYCIIPTKVVIIDWLSFLKKFNKIHFALYGKTYFDSGYTYSGYSIGTNNSLSNKLLYSGGFGLDFVTYYDINLSIEYSFNMLLKSGVFFTFKGPLI